MEKKGSLPLAAALAAYICLLVFPRLAAVHPTVIRIHGSFSVGNAPRAGPAAPPPPESEETHVRRGFEWIGPDKNPRRVEFRIARSEIKREQQLFGAPRELQRPAILKQKGFLEVSPDVFMVHYQEIFRRNLEYFTPLTLALHQAVAAPEPPLHDFLAFTQSIRYERPPAYYNNKFINSFFPPLVCLYEQYGDCDSKSVLLADFLTSHHPDERTALVLIRSQGLNHALLAVKQDPMPGMSSIFVKGSGYYIPLETSGPGWAPGFLSERIWSVVKTGNFIFLELR